MYQIDFTKPGHIHFIGIGGISMSGLAEVLLEQGFTVSGSDARESELTKRLIEHGARVAYGQRAQNITEGIDAVVYTAAVHADNPEFLAAVERGIPILTRAELLGQIMKNYRQSVAVSGTHGKTTTTSMLTEILMAAKKDPTISVGGMLDSIGGNIRVGGPGLFVTEACEYTNSFLSFFPTMEIILNVEADHLDFFKDLDEIRRSFRSFAELLPEGGTLILNSDIRNPEYFYKGLPIRVITVGSDPQKSRYSAADIVFDERACASYTLLMDGSRMGTITLKVPGLHNVYNSLAAIAAAHETGVQGEVIQEGLLKYSGTHRRFEKKGVIGGVTVIDDYAHHPQEIAATLSAAKNYPHREIWCVFQPHTYTRTKLLLEDFAKALSAADHVVLADIYAARETDTLGMSSALLAEKISGLGTDTHYFPSFDEIETFLLKKCINGDLLITMGAGDIVKVGERLLGQ
ncbi:MAG: UDP-N-acetylmuramate--L-alanine ligase [Lachnospiraceae bacterium]|jgi:UDP-N-acetylmuramate--alanine ligase|nr:UDP-N-acetylmuramate--L-alanine ligase [Lachnospiraceae bacterium]